MISEKDYLTALATVRTYEKEQKERVQQKLIGITEDLNAYFTETGQTSMLDFYMSVDPHWIIRITFKAIDEEDLTGEEPFLKKLEEIGKKHEVAIRVPHYYFMK